MHMLFRATKMQQIYMLHKSTLNLYCIVHTEKIVCISKTRANKNQYSINLGHPAEKERSVRDGDCSVHYQTCTAVDMPFVALDASDPSCCHLTGSSYVI